MYTKVTYDLGEVREIQKYYPLNYGAPGCPREKKKKKTPEEIKKQNETNKRRRFQRLLIANFGEGDIHMTLTYRKDLRPETMDGAVEQRAKFLRSLKREYQKAGYDLKYLGVTEIGSKGAVHHHIVINNPDGVNVTKIVQKFWPNGQQYQTPLYEDGEFEQLSSYLVKEDTKGENTGTSYTSSRNLIRPEPKREKVISKRWKDPPKAPKGWEMIKETLFSGINPVTGYPYQRYMIRRIHEGKHLRISDDKRPTQTTGLRSRSPGGRDLTGPGNKDGKARDRRQRERSKP